MKARHGVSLIELLVVLVLLGLASSATALALREPTPTPATWRTTLLKARRQALETGSPVTGWLDSVGTFTAFPSGAIVADSGHRVSPAGGAHAR